MVALVQPTFRLPQSKESINIHLETTKMEQSDLLSRLQPSYQTFFYKRKSIWDQGLRLCNMYAVKVKLTWDLPIHIIQVELKKNYIDRMVGQLIVLTLIIKANQITKWQ